MKIFSLFQKKQTERIRFGQAVHPPSSKTKWQKHLTCSRRKKQGRGGQKQGRHAWPKFQIFHPLTKAKKKNYGAQDEGNSCSKMKLPKNWNNFSERCQENRKEKESTCVPPTERNHFHQTYDQQWWNCEEKEYRYQQQSKASIQEEQTTAWPIEKSSANSH